MKLSFGVLLSGTVVLAFGVALTHWAGDPPTSDPLNVRIRQPVPKAETSAAGARSDNQTET